jgi:hypothetical protein
LRHLEKIVDKLANVVDGQNLNLNTLLSTVKVLQKTQEAHQAEHDNIVLPFINETKRTMNRLGGAYATVCVFAGTILGSGGLYALIALFHK